MGYAVTASGQITLPKYIRDRLNISIGDQVAFEVKKDQVSIRRELSDEEFFAQLDALKSPQTKALMQKHAGKTVAELRELPEYKQTYAEEYK